MAETTWEFDITKVQKPTSAPRPWLKKEEAPAAEPAPVAEEKPKKAKKKAAEPVAEEAPMAEETKPE